MLTGCGRFGHPELRQAIASHVRDWRGIAARPEQVLVTSGATEALDICLHALASAEGRVGVEDPASRRSAALPRHRAAARAIWRWMHKGQRCRGLGMRPMWWCSPPRINIRWAAR